jgi:hypothetical protein
MPPYVDVARPARPLGSNGIEPAPPAKETAVIQGSRKESVGVMTCRLIVDLAAGSAPVRPVRPGQAPWAGTGVAAESPLRTSSSAWPAGIGIASRYP